MFLKDDKYPYEENGEVKACRCIQYRQKIFCLCYAQFIKPIEHYVYNLEDQYGTRVIAKMRNSHQRASDLRKKFDVFTNPWIYLFDISKMDAHTDKFKFRLRHNYYKWLLKNKTFNWMMRFMYKNKGRTKNGVKFETPATVMSGELDTGLGHCVVMIATLAALCDIAGIPFTVYVDGDDSVLFAERQIPPSLIKTFFPEVGFKALGKPVRNFEDIEFCQSRPVFDGVAWRMVRDPERVMLRSAWITKRRDPQFIKRLIKSVGMCELALNDGIPILQAFALKMIESGDGKFTDQAGQFYQAKNEYFHPTRARARVVRYETRVSFERAFGITIPEQLSIEGDIAKGLVQPTAPSCYDEREW
jgi:hypothetical protein